MVNFLFDLNTIWFILIGVFFTGYLLLDGFDFGVGAVYLFSKSDSDRRTLLNSIGPFWDGNEVWLVAGGTCFFAAFPEAYATIFSGFYLALMFFLFAIIFRGVAIDFRGKRESARWKKSWDIGFSISSVVLCLLIGVALGNVLLGLPLDKSHEFTGTFFGLLNPFSLLVGVTTLFLFAMHGSLFALMKTENKLQDKLRTLSWVFLSLFGLFFMISSILTVFYIPRVMEAFRMNLWLWAILFVNVLAVANVLWHIVYRRFLLGFLSSCLVIFTIALLFALISYPHLVFSTTEVANSLTIYNAASSPKTLGIILTIAGIGMPLVIAYTIAVYWIFRGKVKLDQDSY
ncbi:cytochrome d ubiquinol oxidase subunit II [Bdellovibrionota bacterium]